MLDEAAMDTIVRELGAVAHGLVVRGQRMGGEMRRARKSVRGGKIAVRKEGRRRRNAGAVAPMCTTTVTTITEAQAPRGGATLPRYNPRDITTVTLQLQAFEETLLQRRILRGGSARTTPGQLLPSL